MDDSTSKTLLEDEVRRLIADVKRPTERMSACLNNPWSLAPDEIRAVFPMSPGTMGLVVELFRESCDERIGRIRDPLASGDRAELSRNTHALRGCLAMFASAMTLEIITRLELEVSEADPSRSIELLETLEQAIHLLQPTLNEMIAENDESTRN